MIADLKPYESYSDTQQKWLGEVPEHWQCLPHRAIFKEVKEREFAKEQMLSVTIKRGIIPQADLLKDSSKKDSSNTDKSKYKLVCPEDLAYNKMRAWQGAVGVSQFRGIISPAYVVMRPREKCITRYFHYLYRTPYFAKEAERWSYGITSDMWSLRPEDFKLIYSVVPPNDEQQLIVRFLDWASVRCEKAIRAKRRVIALLEEQKQAIIHRAVTRGLDDTVSLKPSGLDWLGGVPEHWDVKRAGALFAERKENGIKGLPLLVVSLNTGVTVGEELDHRGREKRLIADVEKYSLTRKGDIAYNMMRMWQGAVGIVPTDGMVSPAYVVARPRTSATNSSYYELFFRTDACKGEINRQSTGIVSDRNRLYWDSFKQLKLPVPPETEQQDIVEGVREKLKPLEQTKASLNREIELIREYRTRLISDVVTGKLDVRDVARSLPDESERSESIDLQLADADLDDFADDERETRLAEEAV